MKYNMTTFALKHSYRETDANTLVNGLGNLAADYKRRVTSTFLGISGDDILSKVLGDALNITKKVDGELQAISFDGTHAIIVNTGGKARTELPCVTEAAAILASSGHTSCCFAAELHTDSDAQRGRVYDVSAALGANGDVSSLKLAVFDVISIDDKPFVGTYIEALDLINSIFSEGNLLQPISQIKASSTELPGIFDEWVMKGGAEGLVVRGNTPINYKIKQLLTLDMVITGYTVRDNNTGVSEIQLGFIDDKNNFRIVGVTGNGMTDKVREQLLSILTPLDTSSQQIATNSQRVAFRPVKPQIVVEISCNDLLSETTKGSIRVPCHSWNGESYTANPPSLGVSLIHPVFVRLREDKSAVATDAGFSQVNAVVQLIKEDNFDNREIPKSEIIFREVYCKKGKDGDMVQKFMAWKTNKEVLDQRYPAYVFHYTNYSPSRAEKLKREIRISSDVEQIMCFAKDFIAENVKKGWECI